jgi:hypothetical protein
MTRGVISRVSHLYGTTWGRIGVSGSERECFFNKASLLRPEDFDELTYGSQVEFEEQPDKTHGSRAVRLTIVNAIGRSTAGGNA